MSTDIEIRREDGPARGRYVVDLGDGAEAELTYGREEPGIIVADHTYVPRSHRGRGIAERLVQAAVADARGEGTRIRPACVFVLAQFRRHPEWADLRA